MNHKLKPRNRDSCRLNIGTANKILRNPTVNNKSGHLMESSASVHELLAACIEDTIACRADEMLASPYLDLLSSANALIAP